MAFTILNGEDVYSVGGYESSLRMYRQETNVQRLNNKILKVKSGYYWYAIKFLFIFSRK